MGFNWVPNDITSGEHLPLCTYIKPFRDTKLEAPVRAKGRYKSVMLCYVKLYCYIILGLLLLSGARIDES